MKTIFFSLCLLTLGMSVGGANATVIYVDASHTASPQNGGSWANAFSSFQAGVNAASAGDTVWVAQGDYSPSNVLVPFAMKEGVKIFGGFLNTNTSFSQRNFTTNISRLQNSASKVMYNSTALSQAAVLDGFTIHGGGSTAAGGGIANDNCSPVIRNCHFINNSAGNGGGIANNAVAGQVCAPLIDSCIFDNNIASIAGGAMANTNCSPVINNCSFINNTRGVNLDFVAAGGAIYNYQSVVVINNCSFTGNNANAGTTQPMGGAIYNLNSTITLTNSSFDSNFVTAPSGMNILNGFGGAIYSSGSNLVVGGCSFTANKASSAGGAVYVDGGSITVANCSFNGNILNTPYDYIPKMGAGIYINNIDTSNSISNCTFTGNNITYIGSMGGGIYVDHSSPFLDHNTFTGNKAQYGGAVFNASAMPQIRSCIFSSDTATQSGGAVFDSLSSSLLINCLLYLNVADSFGGAYYSYGSSAKIINTTISQNLSSTGGSLYSTASSAPRLLNTIAWGNTPGFGNDAGSGAVAYYSLLQGYPADAAHHNINGSLDPLFTNAGAGDFTLQLTSPCINSGNNDSIPDNIVTDLAGHARIFANNIDMGSYEVPLPPEVVLGADTTICAGSTIILDAGNQGATYAWSNGETSRTLAIDTAGTFWVTVTDSMGSASDTITISISALPVVHLGNDTTLTAGHSLILDAGNTGATYHWSTGALTQSITITASGIYSVLVTNPSQCSASDTIKVDVSTGITATAVQQSAYWVNPNPTRNNIVLDVKDGRILQTTALLTDISGRVISETNIKQKKQPISLWGLEAGIYLLKVKNTPTIRIVKLQE